MIESHNTTVKNKKIILSIALLLVIIVSLAAGSLFLFSKDSNQPTTAIEATEEYKELNCEDESGGDMLASVVNNTTDEDCVFAGCGEFFQ